MLQGMTQTPDIKPRSRDVTDGLEKTAARGMLRAVGLGDDDFAKPQIGVASSWNEITPCNLSLDRLAKAVKDGVHPGAATRSSSARSPSPTASRWATRACTSASSPARSSPTLVETVMKRRAPRRVSAARGLRQVAPRARRWPPPASTWRRSSCMPGIRLASTEHPRLAALGTVCPDHFLRTKVKPLVLDRRPTRRWRTSIARLTELHAAYRDDYRAYYERHATADSPADARRRPGDRAGARRGHVLLRREQADRPGGRRVLRQRDQRDARRRGGLDVRADRRGGEVPDRVLGAGGGQAAADAETEAAGHPDRVGHRRRHPGSARRSRTRLAAEGACVVIADLDAGEGAGGRRRDRQRRCRGRAWRADVTDEAAVAGGGRRRGAGVRRVWTWW